MSRAEINSLKTLIGNADAAGYTLPVELVNAAAAHTKLSALQISPPDPFEADTAAARVVAAVAGGEDIDLLALGHRLRQAVEDRQAFEAARTIAREAQEQASNRATLLAADMVEKIITDHLRPALEHVHEQARRVAVTLQGHNRESHTLLSAPDKIRKAAGALPELASRRAAIYQARHLVNAIGHRQPEHDGKHLFGMFRRPMAFHPTWSPPAQIPRLPIPEDPTKALLWMVSDATAAAEPWLPTIAEQDQAWWEQFGEAQQIRAHAAQFARGFATTDDTRPGRQRHGQWTCSYARTADRRQRAQTSAQRPACALVGACRKPMQAPTT